MANASTWGPAKQPTMSLRPCARSYSTSRACHVGDRSSCKPRRRRRRRSGRQIWYGASAADRPPRPRIVLARPVATLRCGRVDSSECTNATSRPLARSTAASDRARDPSRDRTNVEPSAAHRDATSRTPIGKAAAAGTIRPGDPTAPVGGAPTRPPTGGAAVRATGSADAERSNATRGRPNATRSSRRGRPHRAADLPDATAWTARAVRECRRLRFVGDDPTADASPVQGTRTIAPTRDPSMSARQVTR